MSSHLPTDIAEAQGDEHEAWLTAMAEFNRVFPDADINDERFNPLVRALELWGERLVALRVMLPHTIDKALEEHVLAYVRADVIRRDQAKTA